MCDTFIAMHNSTENGNVIFGKNSDRPWNEIQKVEIHLKKEIKHQSHVRCTYIEVSGVKRNHSIIISRPTWMWGAEMGVNDKGVVIGNEAVWTLEPYNRTGLLGMDLLRLGLETGRNAKESLDSIVKLLEEYGQGGNCIENGQMLYHNSFLIADRAEAWVLETAGKYWVAEHITEGVRSISNELSIRTCGDLRHENIIDHAVELNKCRDENDFDFALIFSDGIVTDRPSPYSRAGRVITLCNQYHGRFTKEIAKRILRDHEGNICMHGGLFETTGSQISEIDKEQEENSTHLFITKPHPCEHKYKKFNFN
ncbi:MAG: C69 family dipeptidase [Promethearchaeota archaeon]